ncbi:MAG: succinate dehydrogenase, cytochrome b556 subunit [Rhodocyclaceae bacterium]|jgi:succinate dehydrogenase / fumarate reductase cytochrome b subunit|nr:succinate dehydrogenase, cytochrome b556 subunit [Rhodocyclaceae bacterium]MBK6907129.1 succinate dehydrogenase, cytochrome b556 subunit [Rhodocyclaceae bacterium]
MAETTKTRPKFLDLAVIRLPLPGFVSILHRVSGAGLFLILPFLLCLLQLSLDSRPEAGAAFLALTGNVFVKLLLLGLCWAYLHHFCAGIRFLLLDVHVGIEIDAARRSAKAVMVVSLLLTTFVAAKIFGGI